MQSDGNLGLYCGTTLSWSSRTNGQQVRGGMVFDEEGNLVLYNNNGAKIWSSGTYGINAALLRIKDNGNLILFNSSWEVLWQTSTHCAVSGYFHLFT